MKEKVNSYQIVAGKVERGRIGETTPTTLRNTDEALTPKRNVQIFINVARRSIPASDRVATTHGLR
jgi:hypothetical protein